MGVDANLFVTCGKDKVIEVGQAVQAGLDKWLRDMLDCDVVERGYTSKADYTIDMRKVAPRCRVSNGVEKVEVSLFSMYTLFFQCRDHSMRMLRMHTDCSCDYSDTYDGDKIIFSLGCWGKSDEIMQVVAKSVAPFGDVYYDHNDCDDEDFIKLFDK